MTTEGEDLQRRGPTTPILIGQLVSNTGNNPGKFENEAGARLAIDAVNQQGGVLGGRMIELVTEDDATSPEVARHAFERLADQEVSAVIGSSYSNANIVLMPLVQELGIPYVSTGAADRQVEPISSHVFMTPLRGRLIAERLAQHLAERKIRRIVVTYDRDSTFASSSWAVQQDLLPKYGVEVLGVITVQHGTTDFSEVFAETESTHAEAIVAWVTGPPAIAFGAAYAASGSSTPLFVSHGAATQEFALAAKGSVGAIVAAAPAATAAEDLAPGPLRDASLALTRPFRAKYGRIPSQFAIDGYVAASLIVAAIENAQDTSRNSIRDALEHVELVTPQGHYRYAPSDHAGLQVRDVMLTRVADGEFYLI